MDEDLENQKISDKIKNFLKENKFKIGFLIFALAFTFFAFYYLAIYSGHKKTNITSSQIKCDAQAKKIFNNMKGESISINYTYKTHYIGSLDRCYILVHGVGVGQIGISDKLIDVFKNETVANCESFTTAHDIDFCSYNGSSGIKYNIDQFNSFVKPYMESK